MDFFEHQDRAHRRSGWLIVLFCLAVLCIVICVHLAVWASMVFGAGMMMSPFNPKLLLWTVLGTCTTIAIGTLYQTLLLRAGGKVVAESLGGRLVNSQTTDPKERQLLNIVEEMSLAAGMPVPDVYLLPQEEGINAFAAGHDTSTAVVGMTEGCLKRLSRDELQGVVAHEFSHILNGDMRINIRLIGMLHGIFCIAIMGRVILRALSRSGGRSSSRSGKGGGGILVIALLGLALLVIGYIGVLFGKLIQAALSRQREFLADASAVQFTRNPQGIVGALSKIAQSSSVIENPSAEQASHLFFSQSFSSWLGGLLATHPPLHVRIKTIDQSFEGQFKEPPSPISSQTQSTHPAVSSFSSPPSTIQETQAVPPVLNQLGVLTQEGIEQARVIQNEIPDSLMEHAREPYSARAIIYGLIMGQEDDNNPEQLNIVMQSDRGALEPLNLLLPQIQTLATRNRLPLMDLCFPALRQLSLEQYRRFEKTVDLLAEQNQSISLFEYMLQRAVKRHLKPHFEPRPAPSVRLKTIGAVLPDCIVLLSLLANLHDDESLRGASFQAGLKLLHPTYSTSPLDFEHANLATVDASLIQLNSASSVLKKRILHACHAVINYDKTCTEDEEQILRIIADSLDCPLLIPTHH